MLIYIKETDDAVRGPSSLLEWPSREEELRNEVGAEGARLTMPYKDEEGRRPTSAKPD